MYMTTIPLAAARAQLSQYVDAAMKTHERIEITRNGSRAAVLLGVDDYDSLLETVEILTDKELVQELNTALTELATGETHDLDDVLVEMRERGRAAQ